MPGGVPDLSRSSLPPVTLETAHEAPAAEGDSKLVRGASARSPSVHDRALAPDPHHSPAPFQGAQSKPFGRRVGKDRPAWPMVRRVTQDGLVGRHIRPSSA